MLKYFHGLIFYAKKAGPWPVRRDLIVGSDWRLMEANRGEPARFPLGHSSPA